MTTSRRASLAIHQLWIWEHCLWLWCVVLFNWTKCPEFWSGLLSHISNPTRNYFTQSCTIMPLLGMKTEGASVNSKAVSSGEDRKGKTRLGWEAEFITLNNLSVTPGNRHQNKSFPSVVSLSLWLIPRKILETSWLVLWPQHLGCAEGWQIYFGIAPPCSGHWERHSRDFANEAAVIFHESLWSIHQLADPLIYGPSACLGVERT